MWSDENAMRMRVCVDWALRRAPRPSRCRYAARSAVQPRAWCRGLYLITDFTLVASLASEQKRYLVMLLGMRLL